MIDPYCGSGTTGIAAKILNCNFIGIDNSKQYLNTAEERIANYQNFLKEAQLELDLHNVKESFSEKKAKGKTKNRFISPNQNLLNF